MKETHVNLAQGDTLIIHAVPKTIPTPEPELEVLIQIGSIPIFQSPEGTYVCFTSDLDICNDGSGPAHGDPYHQSQTAYYNQGKFLNADVDKYIVIPPQIRSMTKGVVMGCQARLTNTQSNVVSDAVVGDIGPKDKTGEAAYALAKTVNPKVTHNSGDSRLVYFYELWPDVPAQVNGKTYKLEPAT
jgi:hypothetical protein